jgi:Ras-related protein Rab-2A
MTTQKVKVIVIGDSTCGKSSLLRQFVDNRFDPAQDMTVGVDLGFKTISLQQRNIKVQIWDTSGQEVFIISPEYTIVVLM